MKRNVAGWLSALVLASCGDDAGNGTRGDATGDPDTPGGVCVTCGSYGRVLGALCDLHARCPDATYPVAYRDRRECMDIFGFLLTCRLDDYEIDDVNHYRLVQSVPEVDESRLDACVAWLASAECSTLGRALDDDDDDDEGPTNPCDGVIVSKDAAADDDYYGTVGEACDDRSCNDSLYCSPATLGEDGAATCAVCLEKPGVGVPCAQYQCADGTYCDGLQTPPLCVAMFAADAPCEGDYQCRSQFCHPDSKVCVAGGELGEACAADNDCRIRFCDAGTCRDRRQRGAACSDPAQCYNGICEGGRCGKPDGATCEGDHECAGRCDATNPDARVCVPRLVEGAACTQDDECATSFCGPWARTCQRRCDSAGDCRDGEYCNWSSSTCAPQVDDGGYCEDHAACRTGNCRADERCGPPPQVGDACGQSYECHPLGFCDGGQCAARKSSGQACTALDSCLEPMLCVSGQCKMMNLECKPAPAGKMCAWLRVCADNAYCDVFDGFVCKPKKQSGQECFRTEDCAAGLRCVTNAEQTGLACAPRLAAGETCSEGSDCADGLFCIAGADTRTCGAGPAGQPCDAYDPDLGCPAGYFCNGDEQCQAPGGDGADCYYEQPCLPGFYCDTSTCRAQLTEGASCSSSDPDQCAAGLYCGSEYVCTPRAGLDAECQSWPEGQCQAGLVCEYVPEETLSRCRAGAPIGEDCYDDEQCASGVCHDQLGCVASAECTMP